MDQPQFDQLPISVCGTEFGWCFMPILCAIVLGMGPAQPHVFHKKAVFIASTGVPGTMTPWQFAAKRTWGIKTGSFKAVLGGKKRSAQQIPGQQKVDKYFKKA